jgi:hypothetical protein
VLVLDQLRGRCFESEYRCAKWESEWDGRAGWASHKRHKKAQGLGLVVFGGWRDVVRARARPVAGAQG